MMSSCPSQSVIFRDFGNFYLLSKTFNYFEMKYVNFILFLVKYRRKSLIGGTSVDDLIITHRRCHFFCPKLPKIQFSVVYFMLSIALLFKRIQKIIQLYLHSRVAISFSSIPQICDFQKFFQFVEVLLQHLEKKRILLLQ